MLDFDWTTILWEIANFLIITIALYFLVFKPIVKRSDARAAKKRQLLEETIKDRQTAASELAKIETRLINLDSEIQKITSKAYEQTKLKQTELLEATHEEARHILQEALTEARKQQQYEMEQHQTEFVELILQISSQALKHVTPDEVNSGLIEELNAEIWDMGKTDMRQVQAIRDSLTERTPTVKVASAVPLTAEQQRNLVRTFSALADRDVNIELETDPELIAGIKVRIGDLIVENSLTSQLLDIKEEINTSLEDFYGNND